MSQFYTAANKAFDFSLANYELLFAIVDQSLKPRPPTILYDKMVSLIGSSATGAHVLDTGCGSGDHMIEIARRLRCRVTGVDIVTHNIDIASQRIAESELADCIEAKQDDIQDLHFDNETFDLVWCRDTLSLIPDLPTALAECARVLKPERKMLIYNTFATDLMEPEEAIRVYAPMGVIAKNMSVDYFETSADATGFNVIETDHITTEWREYFEEYGSKLSTTQLIRIARMRRDRAHIIEEVGRMAYEIELADCHWGVYQMLGKLEPIIYTLNKRS